MEMQKLSNGNHHHDFVPLEEGYVFFSAKHIAVKLASLYQFPSVVLIHHHLTFSNNSYTVLIESKQMDGYILLVVVVVLI